MIRWMELCTTELYATFEMQRKVLWPELPGSLLRGLFGRGLRKRACKRLLSEGGSRGCESVCELPEVCLVSRLFEPQRREPPPHRFLAGTKRPPPPFVLRDPMLGKAMLGAGDRVEVGIVLFGERSDEEVGTVMGALEEMGSMDIGRFRDPWAFAKLDQAGARNRRIEVTRVHDIVQWVRIEFETPAWVEMKGRVTLDLDFQSLFRAAARRITTICALYGALSPDHDDTFAMLDALAAKARVVGKELRHWEWKRRSRDADVEHPMRGLVGFLEIEGELGPLVPWLRWGEVVHVGKASAFGLGRIKVTMA